MTQDKPTFTGIEWTAEEMGQIPHIKKWEEAVVWGKNYRPDYDKDLREIEEYEKFKKDEIVCDKPIIGDIIDI